MPTNAPNLKDLLSGAQLPALPQSAIMLLELSQNPDNGPAEFAKPIEGDPGLTGQVLRFVNSSYFGFAREISSIKLAITLVGVRTIKNFALWSAVFSLMPNPKCGPFDLKTLWQDSLRRAVFARNFGKLMGLKDSEDLFAAALLQDMAIPLISKELPERYLRVLAGREGGMRRLSDVEMEVFGWTHADAAAAMSRQWSLPEEFAVLIEQHCHLEQLLNASPLVPGPVSVALSSQLPAVADDEWFERDAFDAAFKKAAGPACSNIPAFLAEVDKQFAEFAPVLKLQIPARSLADFFENAEAGV
jgi:HD-like signal output (HDOD) protein